MSARPERLISLGSLEKNALRGIDFLLTTVYLLGHPGLTSARLPATCSRYTLFDQRFELLLLHGLCHKKMPVSHLGLTVSEIPAATSFYLATLAPLGYRYIGQSGDSIGLGVEFADFFLTQHPRG